MPAKYVSLGRVLKYTPSSTAVARGDVVVIGNIVGVAIEDIPVGTTGGVAISGIFEGPKATGSGTAISQGFSLHAQGWPVAQQRLNDFGRVLPARAGMARHGVGSTAR